MAEQPLSAALLVADVFSPTFDGTCDNAEDPFGEPPCTVRPFATGFRNTYDFVHHSNGRIYATDNGLGVTGTFPRPTGTDSLGNPTCEGYQGVTPQDNPGSQPDLLHLVEHGSYAGHPNPSRGRLPGFAPECTYYYNGSNPLQVPVPPPHYAPPLLNLGTHKSANGILEYRSSEALCGTMAGDLLLVNFSLGDDLSRVRLSPDGTTVAEYQPSLVSGFSDPLAITQNGDGVVFVGEFLQSEFGSGHISVLIPRREGCWEDEGRAPAPEPVLDAGSSVVENRLFMVGGKNSGGYLAAVRSYSAESDSWSSHAPLPTVPVENPAVVAHEGQLYLFGGSTAPFSGAVSSVGRYDPATDVWTPLHPMPTPRGGATAQVLDGRIFVVGGMDDTGFSLDTVEVYDPVTDSWSSAPPLLVRRDNPASAVVGGALYLFGGRTRNSNGSVVDGALKSVEVLVPSLGVWQLRAEMPTGRRALVSGVIGGRIVAAGGESTTGGVVSAVEEYDPATDLWRALSRMPAPRHGMAFGVLGNRLHLVGGGVSAGATASTSHTVLYGLGG
jgi:N-acetylneuraminic acid mutarotase